MEYPLVNNWALARHPGVAKKLERVSDEAVYLEGINLKGGKMPLPERLEAWKVTGHKLKKRELLFIAENGDTGLAYLTPLERSIIPQRILDLPWYNNTDSTIMFNQFINGRYWMYEELAEPSMEPHILDKKLKILQNQSFSKHSLSH